MKTFNSIAEAEEYAAKLSKYSSEVAMVEGKPSFLCSTGIPFEERLRDPIEIAAKEFLDELGVDDSEDISTYIGAEMSSVLADMIKKEANINIVCSWLNY